MIYGCGIEYALSDADIEKLLKGKTTVIQYSEFEKMWRICERSKKRKETANKILNKLTQRGDNCVILYNTKKNYGHWCCLINHGNRFEFFDSYGIKPDYELGQIDEEVREELGENEPYLSKLLKLSGKPIEYNAIRLQKYKNGVNTCGKHCVVRIMAKKIPIDEYGKILKKRDPDQVVDKIVSNLL